MEFTVSVNKKPCSLNKFVANVIIRGEVICTFVQDLHLK
jgi:hypothetical protein